MRILLVSEFFPQGRDLKFSGGVEARTYFVAKYLAKKHDVHIICTRQKVAKKFEKIAGIKIHRVGPTLKYAESASIYEIPNKIGFIINAIRVGSNLKPDIADGANFIAHFIAKRIATNYKIPVVFWYPDVFLDLWIKNSKITGVLGWMLERYNLTKSADQFLAISKSTAQKLEHQGVNPKKISQIPCGVDLSEFKIKVNKNRVKKIICISRLVPYKRIKDLILAFALILKKQPNLQLTIVGSGPEKGRLTGLVKNLKIANKIRFLQNMPRIKLIKELKSSHLFCLPSAVEGFGISILEAAAAEIPYVVSNISAFKEVTKNAKGGLLFELGDVLDLSQKIERLLKDKNIYRKKVSEAHDLAKIYSWQEIAHRTEQVYANLLK